jgi:hypothetical protein
MISESARRWTQPRSKTYRQRDPETGKFTMIDFSGDSPVNALWFRAN